MTLATAGFEGHGKTTQRATFLRGDRSCGAMAPPDRLIEPVYPKPGNGRPPVGVERMPRIYFLEHYCNLSDAAIEEALYDSLAKHGEETRVWRPTYRSQIDVIKPHAPNALDFNQRYRHRGGVDQAERARNLTKSMVRSKVEHALDVIKRLFGPFRF